MVPSGVHVPTHSYNYINFTCISVTGNLAVCTKEIYMYMYIRQRETVTKRTYTHSGPHALKTTDTSLSPLRSPLISSLLLPPPPPPPKHTTPGYYHPLSRSLALSSVREVHAIAQLHVYSTQHAVHFCTYECLRWLKSITQ